MDAYETIHTTRALRRLSPDPLPDDLLPSCSTPRCGVPAVIMSRGFGSSRLPPLIPGSRSFVGRPQPDR